MADYNPKARRARPELSADETAPVDALLDAVEHSADVPPKKAAEPKPTLNGASAGGSTPAAGAEPVAPANPWVSSVPEPASSTARLVIIVAAVLTALVVIRAVVRRRRLR